MFWSGADFYEPRRNVRGKNFKDASIFYAAAAEIVRTHSRRGQKKSKTVPWVYKNILQRKERLERVL